MQDYNIGIEGFLAFRKKGAKDLEVDVPSMPSSGRPITQMEDPSETFPAAKLIIIANSPKEPLLNQDEECGLSEYQCLMENA